LIEINSLDSLERTQARYLKNLPFLKLEMLSTRPSKITFIEIAGIRVFEVSREVACGIGYFVGSITYE